MAVTAIPRAPVGDAVDNSTHGDAAPILESLSDYQKRKQSQRCTYPGCTEEPGDGGECAGHAERKRERNRRHMARKRGEWALTGRCVQCGRVRREGSKWGCEVCHPTVDTAVDKATRIAAATTARATASNLGRTHWHGQNKRGPMSPEALNRQAIEAATKELSSALNENSYAHSAEVKALPKIQRLSEQARLTGRLYFVIRLVASAPAMRGVDLSDLVESLEDEED